MDNLILDGPLSGPTGGFLDLELPIHGHQRIQSGQTPRNPSNFSQHWMSSAVGGLENDHHSKRVMGEINPMQKRSLMDSSKGKAVGSFDAMDMAELSEDEDPSLTEDGDDGMPHGGKGKQKSPWQRMKWTDDVVRLLIAVVARVGDDGAFEGIVGLKRKSRILQKKGKWKTVSKIMISKGCHVSPQQCEDKFNDMNKRYKKLNEILGWGTCCKVVEKPSLMDSMPQLSAKAKDTVRKILSSKHLFYQEMCAYHNGQKIPNFPDIDLEGSSLQLERSLKDDNASEEEEARQIDDSDDDHDNDSDHDDEELDESDDGERMCRDGERMKFSEGDTQLATGFTTFHTELAELFENPKTTLWEKNEWIKKQRLRLLDQKISIQTEAFNIEQQRFKWMRYCHTKDEEFERLRLENERMRLENMQSILQLRQKQLEMDFKSSESSRDPTSLGIDPT